MDFNTGTLEELLKEFLSEPRTSEGGRWAEVTADDMFHLGEIIYKLIDLKFERDCDDELPVRFHIVDRTKFQTPFFVDIPHTHNADNQTKLRAIELLSMVSKVYTDRLNVELSCFMREK